MVIVRRGASIWRAPAKKKNGYTLKTTNTQKSGYTAQTNNTGKIPKCPDGV